mmetsp:Transcript_20738/g.59441  ORF Transcript_20738/g.59441 Transcript_20738/m.59441 type:complete len:383 (-) Transcript_20738:1360-2508(-)
MNPDQSHGSQETTIVRHDVIHCPMPEQKDATTEIFGTGRGRTLLDSASKKTHHAIKQVRLRNYIPSYQVSNAPVEATFAALGWNRKLVERLWAVFCRINKSLSGEIDRDEFIRYFGPDLLQSISYIDKTFEYFDTTGSGTIDFLEFSIGVWTICTMKVDTLTNFAFGLFDMDLPHGELSFPDVERMMVELFGVGINSGAGKVAMDDITLYAEERGGRLKPADFTIYVNTHQLILFPIFGIQKAIQRHVMGTRFWRRVERKRPNCAVGDESTDGLDPTKVQLLLRTHKSRAPAVLLVHADGVGTVGTANGLTEDAPNNKTANDKKQRPSRWAIIRQGIRDSQVGRASSAVAAVDAFVISGRRATKNMTDKINSIGGVRMDPAA